MNWHAVVEIRSLLHVSTLQLNTSSHFTYAIVMAEFKRSPKGENKTNASSIIQGQVNIHKQVGNG